MIVGCYNDGEKKKFLIWTRMNELLNKWHRESIVRARACNFFHNRWQYFVPLNTVCASFGIFWGPSYGDGYRHLGTIRELAIEGLSFSSQCPWYTSDTSYHCASIWGACHASSWSGPDTNSGVRHRRRRGRRRSMRTCWCISSRLGTLSWPYLQDWNS